MRLNICKSGRDAREISVYSVFFVRISSVAYNGIRKMISNKEQWKNYFAECLKGSEIQIWLIWMATQILVNLNRSLFVLNMRLFILLSSCGLISNREDSLSSNPKQIIRRQANFKLRILITKFSWWERLAEFLSSARVKALWVSFGINSTWSSEQISCELWRLFFM